jgi:acyl-coenzyme A synthetase/AMP-(fatty) acid ligase
MADIVASSLCSAATWIVERGEPDWTRADRELERAAREKNPVLLFGTSLLFLAYFERCDREGIRFELPEGSRAMDTGGAKATGREIPREDVKTAFERVLAIPSTHLVNEYGMTEMGSQFYEDHLRALHRGRPAKPGLTIEPWVRTRVFDPQTMRECAPGESGYLVHYDLTNREIPLAIQTEDVGNVRAGRLTLQGRLPEAERRGCSLPFEKFIGHLEAMTRLAPGQVEFDGDMPRGRLKRKPS